MAQTPQQRRANDKFARTEASKRGKPESTQKKVTTQNQKSPISPVWIGACCVIKPIPNIPIWRSVLTEEQGLFAFVIGGGLLLELLRLFF